VLGNYNVTIITSTLTITKADQSISWGDPAEIAFGVGLDGTQLDAVASGVPGGSAPGALSYSPASGSILEVGDHTLSVEAAATEDYNPASASVTLRVHNAIPTGIALSSSTVRENQPQGTVVGTLSSANPNPPSGFTYTLISSRAYPDNASFSIVGGSLVTARPFNYEARHSYTVRVQVTAAGGFSLARTLTVKVANINEAPSGISLSNRQVVKNSPVGTVVGRLSPADPDAAQTYRYSLVAGTGSEDNAAFTIRSGQLRLARVATAPAGSTYKVRVRVTDQGGLYTERSFKIAVKAPARATPELPWRWRRPTNLQNTWQMM